MIVRGWLIALGWVVAVWAFSWPAHAGVVILTNHTEGRVALPDGRQTQHRLDRDEVVPLPVAPTVAVVFEDNVQSRRCVLRASGIYRLGECSMSCATAQGMLRKCGRIVASLGNH